MAGISHKVELTKEETIRYEIARAEFYKATTNIVADVAIRIGVHPAGYGMYGPEVTYEAGERKWFATWSRLNSCD